MTNPSGLDGVLRTLPRTYAGPGGAVAVLRDGEVIERHAWGYANAERRIPFTPKTLFRMCSITKQFTCGLVLDAFADPATLNDDVRRRLPRLEGPAPSALHLCHNQSGLRDYWALAMLQGSPVEAPFGDRESRQLIESTRSLQFVPGTRYSYCNQNFRLLADILEARTGRSFGELLRTRLFDRVGMESAVLAADTRAMPDGTEGYEGSQATGFRAAENRILWTGDAGLGASLDDMIAWERHIDATRDDPDSLYRRLARPTVFADGSAARYGFGLARDEVFGRACSGHGGALRGWRSQRLYVPEERISVVVMFNHLANAHAAAMDILSAVLGVEPPKPDPSLPAPNWLGTYLEPETGLSVRITSAGNGRVLLRYGSVPERLDLRSDGGAGLEGARLRIVDGDLWMDRPHDNLSSRLPPVVREPSLDVAGRYRSTEMEAEIRIEAAGGVFYAAFSGPYGEGRMELLDPIGTDVWALPCPRGLDHMPPGDWTLSFRRDDTGRVVGLDAGCWLARRIGYERIDL